MNVWVLIAACVAATVAIKGAGPVLLGGRELPGVMLRVIAYLAPALLSALVVTAALADGRELHVGAETVGMIAGGFLLWRGKPLVLAVLVAMVVTAGLRAILLDRNRPGLTGWPSLCAVPGAHSSAVERLPYKQVVAGSIPAAPTPQGRL